MHDIWHYPRTTLAEQVINLFASGLSSALTFFAPRRKGKTEFLLKDIAPLAKSQGYQVFYFSFLDAGTQAQARFIRELDAFATGAVAKAANQLSSVEIYGIKAERIADTAPDDILRSLNKLASKDAPTLLLLDEIQALAGVAHYPIIAALRTALDTNKDKIKVIFTGSSRENLRLMFSSSKAPFFHYGQNLNFPDLPRSFTDHLADAFYQTTRREIDKSALWQAFLTMNQSPQMARALIERMALNPTASLEYAQSTLMDEMAQTMELLPIYHSLGALSQQLLQHIAHGDGELYSQATKSKLADKVGMPPTNAAIQSAMRSLSKKGLIFKKDNGVYEIEDAFFASWLIEQDADG